MTELITASTGYAPEVIFDAERRWGYHSDPVFYGSALNKLCQTWRAKKCGSTLPENLLACDQYRKDAKKAMKDIVITKDNPFFEFVSKSIELGAFEIEIEYKDGYEEITIINNEIGYGLDRLDAGSKEASSLRDQLYSLQGNRRGIIKINETDYQLRVVIYQSFGEDVFRLQIKRIGSLT